MSLKKLSVRTRAAEVYAVQVIIVLFSVMVKGITRVFSVNMPASRVHLSRHGETDNVIIAESGAPALFVLKTGFWG